MWYGVEMEQFQFNFPFQKINKEKRIVTGIATADNIDQSDEQVTFEASQKAFSKWIGNIREMHGKQAVGTAVAYRPVTVWYKGSQYRGIEVDAYISKGAPNAWEKVLDKTYKGFSVGGAVLQKTKIWSKDAGKDITQITDYFLGELSIVDNPDNPTSLFTLIKSAGNGQYEVASEDFDIYYCQEHKIAKANSDSCSECVDPMIKIGTISEFETELINKMVNEFDMQKGEKIVSTEINKAVAPETCADCGATDMNDDGMCKACVITKDAASSKKETEAAAAEDAKDGGKDDAEEDASGKLKKSLQNNSEDDTVKSMEISTEQKVGFIQKFITWLNDDEKKVDAPVEEIAKSVAVDETIVEEVIEKNTDGGSEVNIEDIAALLDTKLEKFKTEIAEETDAKLEAISKSVEVVTTKVEEASTKVDAIDEDSALKKSVDKTDEKVEEKIEKSVPSFWGEIFVPTAVANVFGYEN